MPEYETVCRLDELAESEGKMFLLHGRPIGVFRVSDEVFAMDDRCPHAGASLSRGYLEGDVVRCRIHHWGFRLCNGACIEHENPSYNAQPFPVRVVDGMVQIKVDL